MAITTIYVTCTDQTEASRIGRTLVTERLAACANILPAITSIYEWNQKIETAVESALLLKTQTELIAPITARIKELHSYQCPCIVAWEAAGGNADYFDWIQTQTSPSTPNRVPTEP